MANAAKRRLENVPGDFFVDESCIDCDACRWIAPNTFTQAGDQSAVYQQPQSPQQRMAALQALVSCPTASIGATDKATQAQTGQAVATLPRAIDGTVFHCGFHAESSFGAASWLIVRPGGNVMVDSPRFAMPLVKRIEAMGGLHTLFLTHRDDIADHDKWAAHFGCKRVMHADDARGLKIDQTLQGREHLQLADDLLVIGTPGHTRGSACLLHANRHLFTGDHLAWSARRVHLIGFRDACWYSWAEQVESMKALQALRFEWVLPGHGRLHHASAAEMAKALARCVEWMEK